MDENMKQQLEKAGINFKTGMERFLGNETLFVSFLHKFPKDPSFSQLCIYMENSEVQAAFREAHTLKGVAGNLSLDGLSVLLVPFVERLREEKLEEAKLLFPSIREKYNQLNGIIDELE